MLNKSHYNFSPYLLLGQLLISFEEAFDSFT